MNWNRCHIVIGPGQDEKQVASAIKRLGELIGTGVVAIGATALVVALRAADDTLVGAATFSKVEDR